MAEIKILSEKKYERSNIKIHELTIVPPYPIYGHSACFGLDGGTRNMGVATIYPNGRGSITLYEVSLERQPKPIDRMLDAQYILENTVLWFGYDPKAVIEGAAYMNSIYRQAELAEVRAAMALWLDKHDVQVEFVAPNKIRKAVFGNGREKNPFENAKDFPNAIAALGCAYYALLV